MVRTSSFAMAVGLGALLLMSAPSTAPGQPLTITGRVVDAATLEPIVDATVSVEGDMTSVAVADSAGRYTIAIPRPDVTLVFAALGFAQQETSPAGRTVVNVTLVPRPLLFRDSGRLPCDGAALPSPPALDPRSPPLRLPEPDHPSPVPNACAVSPRENPETP